MLHGRCAHGTQRHAAALTGITIMHVAFEQWVDDPNRTPFQQIARDALAQLREIATAE
jgi:hypothetical protein